MNFFNLNLKKLVFFLFLIALPLISINTEKSKKEAGWYNKPFSLLASLTTEAFYSFSSLVKDTTLMYVDLIAVKRQDIDLSLQNKELMTRLLVMSELEKENARLSALLDFKQRSKMELVAAKVMSRDIVSDHNTVFINKGTRQGLKSGMAVIAPNGVVGYIYKPEALTSQVLLITDRYAVVDGVVARSRARGIVEGKSHGHCTLNYVEKTEDVTKGDIIVTSGIDNIFPKGFPVAVVDSVDKTFSISLRVDLVPQVDFNKLEEVFIVLNAVHEDYSPAALGVK